MRAPMSWLREYVTVDATTEEIAYRLAISALDVERVIDVGVPDVDGNLGRFLVGRVLEVEAHPNADRLRVCQVDVGEGDARQIVCGAWNFEAGATVAVALPGAFLPIFDQPLDERELRGQASRGMILAEDEVGLGDDHAGIMVLPDGPEPGTPLVDVLPIRDQVLDVTPTVNRVDLLSMVGLAREVAALLGGELHPPAPEDPEIVDAEEVDIAIEDFAACPRYIGRVFRDVVIGPSPQWLRSRLFLADMRSISNVVDVTNYVMHVWGSPLHAFDRSKLAGGRIVVRHARAGEELRTLDGTLRHLAADDLLITDGERALALAAIMGGEESEVTEQTSEVLLEAANFEPLGILRSSERLALRTAGSNRWEKGVDPHLAEPAAVLASRMLVDLAGARMTGHADVHDGLPERPVVRLRPERASRVIGLDVPPEEQRETLLGLGFDVSDAWDVTVPTLARARRHPGDRRHRGGRETSSRPRPAHDAAAAPRPGPPHEGAASAPCRRGHARRGRPLRGIHVEPRRVRSEPRGNPAPESHDLGAGHPPDHHRAGSRRSRAHGCRRRLRRRRAVRDRARLPALGRAAARRALACRRRRRRVDTRSSRAFSRRLYGALGLELRVARSIHGLLHPGKAAETDAGWLGELHPALIEGTWGAFELDLETLFAAVPERVVYEDVLTYPAALQDIAVAVDEDVEVGALVEAAREAAGELLREARVFDVYRGDQVGAGRKSVAIHLAFQSPERTLTEDEATTLRDRIVAALAEHFGAELRS